LSRRTPKAVISVRSTFTQFGLAVIT
jgi:hypothetical protein